MNDRSATTTAALVSWLEQRYAGPVTLATPPTTRAEGFDSAVYLVELRGEALPQEWRRPIVLRCKADPQRIAEARREAAVQDWLAERGYPTPRVLAVFAPGELVDRPVQVMERAPGQLVLDRLRRSPWRLRTVSAQLAALQARLHALATQDFPSELDLLELRIGLPRRVAEELDDDALREGLDRVEALAPVLRDAPDVVCHGDFHPMNVLSDGAGSTVIDWTDSGLGDRHGDLARTLLLFELAAVVASNAAERMLLRALGPIASRSYARAYARIERVDPQRLAWWMPVHLLHGWSQARALHAGLLDRGERHDERAERIPIELVDDLRRRFASALERGPTPPTR